MTATPTTRETTSAMTVELPILREAQMALTAAIVHAREEALEPHWSDQLLGLRLRLEKNMVKLIERQVDHLERMH